jgi:hypothetical protein
MNAAQILLIAALVIFLIGRRFAGSPVGARSLLVPVGLTVWGFSQLSHQHGFGALDITLLSVEAVVAVAAGAARAATIKLYVRDGHLWQRYRLLTLGVWIAMIALRVGFIAAGDALGASLPTQGTLLVTFGLSLVVESLLVAKRAAATGTPIMPRQSRQNRRGMVDIHR